MVMTNIICMIHADITCCGLYLLGDRLKKDKLSIIWFLPLDFNDPLFGFWLLPFCESVIDKPSPMVCYIFWLYIDETSIFKIFDKFGFRMKIRRVDFTFQKDFIRLLRVQRVLQGHNLWLINQQIKCLFNTLKHTLVSSPVFI